MAIGVACAALLSGGAGQILGIVLIGLGMIALTSLVFLEIGLSEDRERAAADKRVPRLRKPPPGRPRLGRSRGHRRRLS